MGLKNDLLEEVERTFKSQWLVGATKSVPNPEDLVLSNNHAKDLEAATVLYADLDGSTTMVDTEQWWFSAEVYKTFLRCAAQIIRDEGGTITAYDGDRIMAIFVGDQKNTQAVRCALKINYAVIYIIQPALSNQYPNSGFVLKHVVGIDTSQLRATRTGVRGDNDLVWVGRAANYAAKLTELSEQPTWITKVVYDSMLDEVKYANGINMWTPRRWTPMNNMGIYCSSYWWSFS